jgi:hypothetical protein
MGRFRAVPAVFFVITVIGNVDYTGCVRGISGTVGRLGWGIYRFTGIAGTGGKSKADS